jgi:diphthamide biosynthesis enzyme Dph1/Dph2-like protein
MVYNPSTKTIQEFKGCKKQVMKRYANVERINEAEIVGLLIGTVVCDNHMEILNLLKRAILKQGKKFYEVLIGKINEPKLRNF